MFLDGFDISIFYLYEEPGTVEYNAQKKICTSLNIPVVNKLDNFAYIIDAIIGVGLKGSLREEVATTVNSINSTKGKVFSLDVPTGIGFISDCKTAVNAEFTFSLGVLKASCYLNGNRVKCGTIELLKPLFPKDIEEKSCVTLLDTGALALYEFPKNAYKKTRGDLIIVGSSKDYPSTVLLSADAAFASAVGLVTVYTEATVVPILCNTNPSLMVRPFSQFKVDNKATILLGPGLGSDNDNNVLPFFSLKNRKVIDADGIRAYARLYKDKKIGKLENAIITPHLGELKALFEAVMPTIQYSSPKEYLESLKELSHLTGATLVVKSEVALIVNGDTVFIVDLLNPSMAVAGSGDVLAAVIATLFIHDDNAAINGVLLHKKAGLDAKQKYGYYSAMNLIEMVGQNR